MKYVIIGGDYRFVCLERLMRARGESVSRIAGKVLSAEAEAALREADGVIMNYPVRGEACGLNYERVLNMAKPDARIFLAGPARAETDDKRVVDLWRDEVLIADNAYLTAEGAVAAAMQVGVKSIRECACLVVGWGRIGRSLTEILVAMGAKTTVASRSPEGRNRAIERGATAVDTAALRLDGFDVIFSTPPAMVLDDIILKKAERDVMILDLASPPYGVDLKAAWDLGLRAWREPGLPGRYCPESAAKAILRAIERKRR